MSHNPVLIFIYLLLVLFFAEVAWLFYCAYVKDRRRW